MSALQAAVNKVVAENPDKVQQAKKKPALSGWFVGQVMIALGGSADIFAVRSALEKRGLKFESH